MYTYFFIIIFYFTDYDNMLNIVVDFYASYLKKLTKDVNCLVNRKYIFLGGWYHLDKFCRYV